MKIKKLLKRLRIAKIPKEIKDNTKYCTYCNSKIQSNDTFIQHKGYDFHCDCYIRYLEIKQDVLLKIAKIIKENGANFAFPTSTININKNDDILNEKIKLE